MAVWPLQDPRHKLPTFRIRSEHSFIPYPISPTTLTSTTSIIEYDWKGIISIALVLKMTSLKGPGAAQKHDGSALRIGIVHARWNTPIIEPLVQGTKAKLLAGGVKESNIVVQTVPGSWELPIAVQRWDESLAEASFIPEMDIKRDSILNDEEIRQSSRHVSILKLPYNHHM